MLSRGQARFPLLLTIFLLAGLALSQTEGLPPSLAWSSQSTDASFDGSVYNSANTLTVSNVPAGTIGVLIAGCPSDWVCIADPATFEHAGADTSYPVSILVIAPPNSTGSVSLTASSASGTTSGAWNVNLVLQPPVEPSPAQPPGEPPPEQPPANETIEPPLNETVEPPANETTAPPLNETIEPPVNETVEPPIIEPEQPSTEPLLIDIPPAHVGPGDNYIQMSSCGVINGNTVLTQDIVRNTASEPQEMKTFDTCFFFESNSATLDCNGHSISGIGTAGIYAVNQNGYGPLTIRNCDISGFTIGIFANANGVIITDTVVHDTNSGYGGYGIYISGGTDFTLQRLQLNDNGIGLRSGSVYRFSVKDSNFTGNGLGIEVGRDTDTGAMANVRVSGGRDGLEVNQSFFMSFLNLNVEASGTGLLIDSSENNRFVGGSIIAPSQVVVRLRPETSLFGNGNVMQNMNVRADEVRIESGEALRVE